MIELVLLMGEPCLDKALRSEKSTFEGFKLSRKLIFFFVGHEVSIDSEIGVGLCYNATRFTYI